MLRSLRLGWLVTLAVAVVLCVTAVPISPSLGQDPASVTSAEVSIQEVRSLLTLIDPYLPAKEIAGEIDIFGSTSMDSLVHGWAADFKKFHPSSQVLVSAEGSETVFDRLAKNPSSMGMLSRPVSESELETLRSAGMKRPVAITVAREALAVFVNESNPLDSISKDKFFRLFCGDNETDKLTWGDLGVSGKLTDQPVALIARQERSGTQKFLADYMFRGQTLRNPLASYKSNAEVIKGIESNPAAVAIAGLKCGGHGAKALNLSDGATVVPHDDHAVLMGRYPLMRPLTIVLDIAGDGESAQRNREFVRYALHQSGQTHTILVGFFPFDPPTLRGELLKLEPSAG